MKDIDAYFNYEKEVAKAKLAIIRRIQNNGLELTEKPNRKRTSQIDIVQQVLNTAGYPLHIKKIIELAKRDFDVHLNRDSIVSNIIKKVNTEKLFIRTAPNTFALLSYSTAKGQRDSRKRGQA